MELVQDERIAFVRYHPGRNSFVINSNKPHELPRLWLRAGQLPHAQYDRKFHFIEVPANPITAGPMRELIALHQLEIGQREREALIYFDKVAGDNYALTVQVEGFPNNFTQVKGTPHPFQVIGAELGLRNGCVLIGDEPGLGKTIEGILILSRLQRPAIIICPANAKQVWRRELHNWLPDVTDDDIKILKGSKARRIPDKRFVIVNYELLPWWALYIDELERDVFIVDEIHKLGKPKSKRSRVAEFLLRDATYRIGLTGTAAQNLPRDIIHPLHVLGIADRLGGSPYLMRRFGNAPKTDDVSERSDYARRQLEFHTWLRYAGQYVRRTKKGVKLQLPDKERRVVPIELANEDEYRKAAENFRAWAERVNRMKDGALVGWATEVIQAKLLDLGTDVMPSVLDYKTDFPIAFQGMARINTLKQLAFIGKLPAIKEWVDDLLDSGEKLILFAWFKESQRLLKDMWPGLSTVTALGADSQEHRDRSIDRFQTDPNTNLIICSTKAAGEAITLTAASHVAHVEFPWTPTELEQDEDRAHRIGQTKPVTCWNLVGLDTIEEPIIELLSDKLELLAPLIDGRYAKELPVIGALLSTLLEQTRRDRTTTTSRPLIGTYS